MEVLKRMLNASVDIGLAIKWFVRGKLFQGLIDELGESQGRFDFLRFCVDPLFRVEDVVHRSIDGWFSECVGMNSQGKFHEVLSVRAGF